MKITKRMTETLKWMLDNGGNSINFGCPLTAAWERGNAGGKAERANTPATS